MAQNPNLASAVIGDDFSVFAHDVKIPVAGTGLAVQREGGGNAVFEFHDDAHVIAYVVITTIDASSIGAGRQCLKQRGFCLFQTYHLCGPLAKRGEVAFSGVKPAVFRHRAVHAACSRT